jgi:RNA polymerase sigma factor (sigma-70 family)
MSVLCPYLNDPETQQHLRQKVHRLEMLGRPHGFDQDDLQQHLTWAVQRAWHHYDPSRQSWHPYLRMILAREAATLVRHWRRRKRQEMVLASEALSSVEESGRLRHQNVQGLEERERIQLRLDVIKVVARLPHRLREIATHLPEESISSLARKLQLDRSTIRSRIRQLRRVFEKVHLQDYLDPAARDKTA